MHFSTIDPFTTATSTISTSLSDRHRHLNLVFASGSFLLRIAGRLRTLTETDSSLVVLPVFLIPTQLLMGPTSHCCPFLTNTLSAPYETSKCTIKNTHTRCQRWVISFASLIAYMVSLPPCSATHRNFDPATLQLLLRTTAGRRWYNPPSASSQRASLQHAQSPYAAFSVAPCNRSRVPATHLVYCFPWRSLLWPSGASGLAAQAACDCRFVVYTKIVLTAVLLLLLLSWATRPDLGVKNHAFTSTIRSIMPPPRSHSMAIRN
ncbi:hypothetical protein FKP32DRAFT_174999 [Trametes sanguinea]|nr:hypothetical protein FKP32DRAFT_174999 [Trametes sanguinea]